MHWGCQSEEKIGNEVFFRSGGGATHKEEFIYSSYNEYKYDINNSITSKYLTNNLKIFWFR